MGDRFKRLATLAMVSEIIYLLWLITAIQGVLGFTYFVLEFGMFFLLFLFVVNHRSRSYVLSGGAYSLRAIVDVIIPTKGEPLKMLEGTIAAAKMINHPNIRVYVVDDAGREEVKTLCSKYKCEYLLRRDRLSNAYKAATLNYAMSKSFGNYILVLDADQRVKPTILDDLLGHFRDPKIAYLSTRQWFDVPDNNFNRDNLFYEYMQPGKAEQSVAISCGSGVIYRRSALDKIGGFSEWNIVEDLHTSYLLNANGYKGIYTSQSYTIGEAPADLNVIYKQRGTWALDSLRLFLWQIPYPSQKMNFSQKLHYFEMGYIYLVSALFLPLIFFVNYYALFFNVTFIVAGFWYLVFKLPSFYLTTKLYNELGKGSSSSRMWAALFPVYLRSLFAAMLFKKPKYIVTEKVKQTSKRNQTYLLWPHILLLSLGVIAVIYHLTHYQITTLLIVNFFWFVVIIYWFWPIFAIARREK